MKQESSVHIKIYHKQVSDAMQKFNLKGDDIYKVAKAATANMLRGISAKIPIKTGNLKTSLGYIERNRNFGIKEESAQVLIGFRTYDGFRGYHGSFMEHGRMAHKKGEKMRQKPHMGKIRHHKKQGPRYYKKDIPAMPGQKYLQRGFDEHHKESESRAEVLLIKLISTELQKQGLPGLK